MRSKILDMPNGRELVDELDLATEVMMSMPANLIGSSEWKDAFDRQQRAFKKWREYLHHMADGRVRIERKKVA